MPPVDTTRGQAAAASRRRRKQTSHAEGETRGERLKTSKWRRQRGHTAVRSDYDNETSLPWVAEHCSLHIQATRDDIFVAHSTWDDYADMNRMMKTYYLERTLSFSSYPGAIHSADDFVLTSNGLTIMETTNEWHGDTLSFFLIDPIAMWVPFRFYAASMMANSGREWGEIFLFNNSGTDNADWFILDMNRYDAAAVVPDSVVYPHSSTATEYNLEGRLKDGFVTVAEQWPGSYSITDDATEHFRQAGFLASNNCPYFYLGAIVSGHQGSIDSFGSFMDCWTGARYIQSRRASDAIAGLNDIKDLYRENDFVFDPALRTPNCSDPTTDNYCTPIPFSARIAIAQRGDVAPDSCNGPLGPFISEMPFGAIDAKVASLGDAFLDDATGKVSSTPPLAMHGISGPTLGGDIAGIVHDVFAPYEASALPVAKRHGLQPVFDFPWTETNAKWMDSAVSDSRVRAKKKQT